jgi:hypothetical protein
MITFNAADLALISASDSEPDLPPLIGLRSGMGCSRC